MNRDKMIKILSVMGTVGMAATSAFAEGEPIDLAAAGTTLAGYVATAAGAGIAVYVAIAGVRIIKKAFSAASK